MAEVPVSARPVRVTERFAMFMQPHRVSAAVSVCASNSSHSRKASRASRA